ncbi:carbamoyl-phosphate synthase small chain-like [Ylistrum balloti]|uniref:carbamoyl-phosphate synthase small chain-like n=1 Tax=Ylistrum balloti TaxID=509963 RepID=UPI002905B9FA|nr:carbamoyl-phosphate synthase small chain-like [Ylistrum balloti]
MNFDAVLLLEDGTCFLGRQFASPPMQVEDLSTKIAQSEASHIGEVIFTTSMSGYVEVLSDPSYIGQLVCMTYPMIGNYGVDSSWFESNKITYSKCITVAGLVIHQLYNGPVLKGRLTLESWMRTHNIPGIEGVDTRLLTKHLRDHGAQNGALLTLSSFEEYAKEDILLLLKKMPKMEGRNLVGNIEKNTWNVRKERKDTLCNVAVLDCGAKENIIRLLHQKGCAVERCSSLASAEELLDNTPDMLLISNGPGDPAVLQQQLSTIQALFGKTVLCGICLGHQLLALALGIHTYKMSFGHHGSNHPVQDELSKKLYITSQNHVFAIQEENLPDDVLVWFRNVNDATVEGLHSYKRNIYSVQFHPEACPGPSDTSWIFDYFIQRAIDFRTDYIRE